jgi:hypothetical protein
VEAKETLEKPLMAGDNKLHVVAEDDVMTEDEDEDLDAPPKSQSQRSQPPDNAARVVTPEPTLSSSPKRKGFRIGGAKTKQDKNSTLRDESAGDSGKDEASPTAPIRVDESVKAHPVRRPFKIGGKKQQPADDQHDSHKPSFLHQGITNSRGPSGSSWGEAVRRSPVPSAKVASSPPPEEEHEETLEVKAERKRRELKRKNEELAKKQANKKKKRF